MGTSGMDPAGLQPPTPMTATAMTARMATSRTPRRGASRVRGVVAVICVATFVLLDLVSRCRVCGAVAGAGSGRAIEATSTPALSPLYALSALEQRQQPSAGSLISPAAAARSAGKQGHGHGARRRFAPPRQRRSLAGHR